MSTYDIFFTFVYLINSDNFTYEETLNYCEEIKKSVNAWTFDKDSRKVLGGQIISNIDLTHKIICFPTDTVYGVGASIYDVDAIKKIYIAIH